MDRTPFLAGDTVSLYPVEEEYLERLRDIVNNEDVWNWISVNTPQNLRSEQQFYKEITDDEDRITLAIYSEEDGKVMGTVELRLEEGPANVAEFGIVVSSEHHSKGIGTAATELMLAYAFEQINIHKVWTRVLDHNDKSIGLMEKLGFTQEGRFREHSFNDGDYHDFLLYGILEDEWKN